MPLGRFRSVDDCGFSHILKIFIDLCDIMRIYFYMNTYTSHIRSLVGTVGFAGSSPNQYIF
jgi:hypothetical protein